MSNENQLAVAGPKASDQLATFLGIEKGMMLETLKAQCFKGKTPDQVSDAQLAAFVSTANVLQVNPLVPGMLYAYPERNGGITPILGPDGVFKKLDEMISTGKLKGYKCDVKMGADGKPESATAVIHRGEGQTPAEYTAYFSEWCVTSNVAWTQRPRHMLWVRAIKQAARQVIHGLPMDSDEYEISQMHNVTPEPVAPPPERPAPKPRSPKGAAAVRDNDPKIVDAEVTPVAPEAKPEPAKVEEAPKVVQSEPTPKAEAAPAPTPAPTPAPAPSPKPKATVTQRALLAADEVIEVEAQVDEFKVVVGKRAGKDHPYITARITSPELAGQVSQTDGGIGPDGQPIAAWQLDAPVRLKLRGKKYSTGVMANLVDAIDLAGDASEV